jgi:hypothetical protein
MPILAALMSKGAVPSSGSSRSSRRDRPGSLVPNRAGNLGAEALKTLKTVATLWRRATGACSAYGWYRRIEPDVETERPTTESNHDSSVLYAAASATSAALSDGERSFDRSFPMPRVECRNE